MKISIVSWNVAGIRAAIRKGLWDFIHQDNSDIYCFQETKARIDQVPNSLDKPAGYFEYWNPAEKAGYSGVATFSKLEPKSVISGDRDNDWDNEGRVLITKFDEFTLLNVYFPNGKKDEARLRYKLNFYDYFLTYIEKLRQNGEKIIVCGDVNTAHQEIDLSRPKENRLISGFLDIERRWLDRLVEKGYSDAFRLFNSDPQNYTWWDQKSGARNRNVGWRIDYFFVSHDLTKRVKSCQHLTEVTGSDHCPVKMTIDI